MGITSTICTFWYFGSSLRCFDLLLLTNGIDEGKLGLNVTNLLLNSSGDDTRPNNTCNEFARLTIDPIDKAVPILGE